jgi:hypothetical protein
MVLLHGERSARPKSSILRDQENDSYLRVRLGVFPVLDESRAEDPCRQGHA